jgi:hypothetical protein
VDLPAQTVAFHRVPYPIAETQQRIRDKGLPPIFAERLSYGL